MKAPESDGSPLGKPPGAVKAEGVLEVILGGGAALEVLVAALEVEVWSVLDEEEEAAADADVAVASEAAEVAEVALGLDAVGIALLVDPVSCGRLPCAITVERREPIMSRKSIITEDAEERREDRILAVLQAARISPYGGAIDPRDNAAIRRCFQGKFSSRSRV